MLTIADGLGGASGASCSGLVGGNSLALRRRTAHDIDGAPGQCFHSMHSSWQGTSCNSAAAGLMLPGGWHFK